MKTLLGKRMSVLLGIAIVAGAILAACGPSNAEISTKVKGKIAADETLKGSQIDVDTKNKVVILSGTVDTQAAKERAVALARQTDRVVDVVDQIAVKEQATGAWPPGPGAAHEGMGRGMGMMGDGNIAAAVKSRLMSDSTIGTLKIEVGAHDGIVSLSGSVRSTAEKERAIDLARQTSGVKRVDDQLEVGR